MKIFSSSRLISNKNIRYKNKIIEWTVKYFWKYLFGMFITIYIGIVNFYITPIL